jgi:hypothetical protein
MASMVGEDDDVRDGVVRHGEQAHLAKLWGNEPGVERDEESRAFAVRSEGCVLRDLHLDIARPSSSSSRKYLRPFET